MQFTVTPIYEKIKMSCISVAMASCHAPNTKLYMKVQGQVLTGYYYIS